MFTMINFPYLKPYSLILWHIKHCGLFNTESSLYIYIKYIWFDVAGFYGISTIVGYLMPNPLNTYISNIYDLMWFGLMAYQPLWVIQCQILFIHIYQIYMIWCCWVLWHINHCGLFNGESSLHIYIKYIWFDVVGSYGISTIVGYSMPNPLNTYISNIYDLMWLGLMAYQPLWVIQCRIFFIHIY